MASCSKEYKHKGRVSCGLAFSVCSVNRIHYVKVNEKGRQQETEDG